MNYQITDYITTNYKIVINRLRALVRRTQAVDWILDQLDDVAGEFSVLRDQGYRQDAGALMLALLDFLRPFETDPRYRAFARDIQIRMRVYGLNPTWCRYYPPVKPVDVRGIEIRPETAQNPAKKGIDKNAKS